MHIHNNASSSAYAPDPYVDAVEELMCPDCITYVSFEWGYMRWNRLLTFMDRNPKYNVNIDPNWKFDHKLRLFTKKNKGIK